MLLKLRKKIITWLRDTDDYEFDYRGDLIKIEEDNSCEPEPETNNSPVATLSGRRARKKYGTVCHKEATVSNNETLQSARIGFNVFRGQGGIVIETGYYDNGKHEHVNSLYVVTEDADLGEELSKIILMISLRG